MATELTYVAAVGAGVVSFLSPCVLPLAPAYLSFVAGTSVVPAGGDAAAASAAPRALPAALAFVFGFSVVFVGLGATASALSGLLFDNLGWLARVAGVVIILFGLHYLGLFRRFGVLSFLDRDVRVHAAPAWAGIPGAFLVGVAFAFGWTPCIGPILATILTLAASSDSLQYGASLLAAYSLGLGIPFIAAALMLRQFLAFSRGFRPYLRRVEQGAGVILVVTGVLMFFERFSALGYYLLDAFPALGNIG
ncbi:MAG: cytochrome c biogenesis protein CcdA [Alphaproteobacteria bacterium]|nr:cytochrome c biogenesis protein CcdA [Alphaproteobacteria bacterium]